MSLIKSIQLSRLSNSYLSVAIVHRAMHPGYPCTDSYSRRSAKSMSAIVSHRLNLKALFVVPSTSLSLERFLTPTKPGLTFGSNRLSAIAVASVVFPEATGPTKAMFKVEFLFLVYWPLSNRFKLCFDTKDSHELDHLKI